MPAKRQMASTLHEWTWAARARRGEVAPRDGDGGDDEDGGVKHATVSVLNAASCATLSVALAWNLSAVRRESHTPAPTWMAAQTTAGSEEPMACTTARDMLRCDALEARDARLDSARAPSQASTHPGSSDSSFDSFSKASGAVAPARVSHDSLCWLFSDVGWALAGRTAGRTAGLAGVGEGARHSRPRSDCTKSTYVFVSIASKASLHGAIRAPYRSEASIRHLHSTRRNRPANPNTHATRGGSRYERTNTSADCTYPR